MRNTEKILNAFQAICEEAEKLKQTGISDDAKKRLDTIISIAKHQNDIRQSAPGSCKAE